MYFIPSTIKGQKVVSFTAYISSRSTVIQEVDEGTKCMDSTVKKLNRESTTYYLLHNDVEEIQMSGTYYYEGTAEEWEEVVKEENIYLKVYFYSSKAPSDDKNTYWHYNLFGEPVLW